VAKRRQSLEVFEGQPETIFKGRRVQVYGKATKSGKLFYYKQTKGRGNSRFFSKPKRISFGAYKRSRAGIISYRNKIANELNEALRKALEEQAREIEEAKKRPPEEEEEPKEKFYRVTCGKTYYGAKEHKNYAVMTVYAYAYKKVPPNADDSWKKDFNSTVMNGYLEDYIDERGARETADSAFLDVYDQWNPTRNDDGLKWNGENEYTGYEDEEIDEDEFEHQKDGIVSLNLVFYDVKSGSVKAEYRSEAKPSGGFQMKGVNRHMRKIKGW
jgi:hypothetical protein